MTPEFWIAHADSLFHQIFMLFMGGLYALAMLVGVTYQTMNIYCYFIFYPASFALFLESKKKYWVVAATLLFFAIPNLNSHCGVFFNQCVAFLNYTAKIFNSNYIDMSVYLCVWVPLLLYVPFVTCTHNKQQLKKLGIIIGIVAVVYMIVIYPFFKPALEYVWKNQHQWVKS